VKKPKRFNFYDGLKKEFKKHQEFFLHVNPDFDEDDRFLAWVNLMSFRLTLDELKVVIEKTMRR